ncbi:MAG: zinc ribbon domain-containing protein, partial [Candidatus Bathyarchaeota archaeon]
LSPETYMKAKKELEKKLNELGRNVCPRCDREVPTGFIACPNCGKKLIENLVPSSESSQKSQSDIKPTNSWYLVPLLLGLLGGILGYIAVRDEDREMADNLLFIGTIVTIIGFYVVWTIYTRTFF